MPVWVGTRKAGVTRTDHAHASVPAALCGDLFGREPGELGQEGTEVLARTVSNLARSDRVDDAGPTRHIDGVPAEKIARARKNVFAYCGGIVFPAHQIRFRECVGPNRVHDIAFEPADRRRARQGFDREPDTLEYVVPIDAAVQQARAVPVQPVRAPGREVMWSDDDVTDPVALPVIFAELFADPFGEPVFPGLLLDVWVELEGT